MADLKVRNLVLRKLSQRMRAEFGLYGGLMTLHPIGDRDGDSVFKPHIEVFWWRESEPRSAGYMPAADIERLRVMWKEILGYEGKVNVWTSYLWWDEKTEGRMRHQLQYALRPFPGWSWWRGKSKRWFGVVPKLTWCCPHCHEPMPNEHEGDSCPSCGCMLDRVCPVCHQPIVVLGVSGEPVPGIPIVGCCDIDGARAPP